MRKIILRALEAAGVQQAVEAADGQEALEKFQRGEFDLVLTDREMPRKNGLELVAAIRTRDPHVPILMFASASEKSQVIAAIQAGVTDYLVMPFTADVLQEKLKKYGC
jgi:two-component system chemotaxis response regulator CheY